MFRLLLWIVLSLVSAGDKLFGYKVPHTVYPASVYLKDGDTFDYIVVGAGAGGAPAAARLALSGADVLLVEAGGNPDVNPNSTIPGRCRSLIGSDLDWQYPTIPNNVSCLSLTGAECRFGRGKCLGGSTSINYMMYVRGNRRDYDDLAIRGWTWRDLKPYFLKYEGLQDLDQLPPSSIPYHNTDGILKVEFFANSENPWHSSLVKAFQSLNFPYNYDVNSKSQVGVTQVIGFVYGGERMSTARGYLARDDVKQVLKVSKFTRCTGVILDDDNKAVGITAVLTEINNRTLRLYAKKEIVLSAGTVGTPQILMLSGIGPATHLISLGIPVRADLPVGDNISDHVLSFLFIPVNADDMPPSSPRRNMIRWLRSRTGPLASIGITDIAVFLNTRCYDVSQQKLIRNSSDCELPSVQYGSTFMDVGAVQGAPGLNEDVVQQLMVANRDRAVLSISTVVLKPFSRGNIRLANTDPLENPAIFPNYLADERDVEEMVRGIMILEQLVETPEFKTRDAYVLRLKLPSCPEYEVDREGYWRCYCRHITYSVFHAVGSAQLGGVLDERLRVRGVARLRVADLSAMPVLPRGNTAALAIAIGERVAHFILKEEAIKIFKRRYMSVSGQPNPA